MNFEEFKLIAPQLSKIQINPDDAHQEIVPFRSQKIPPKENHHKEAGVLVLIFPKNNVCHFVLIERPKYNGSHSGQIALPGGKIEQSDKTIIDTALREAHEETNISRDNVNIIKPLSKIFVPPSNFFVTPVLGFTETVPNFFPEKREVKSILEVELETLLRKNNLAERSIQLPNGMHINAPSFEFNNHIVWGATAMILNEFRYLINHISQH